MARSGGTIAARLVWKLGPCHRLRRSKRQNSPAGHTFGTLSARLGVRVGRVQTSSHAGNGTAVHLETLWKRHLARLVRVTHANKPARGKQIRSGLNTNPAPWLKQILGRGLYVAVFKLAVCRVESRRHVTLAVETGLR